MNNISLDMDPLGSYDYPNYDNFSNIPFGTNMHCPYDVKVEHPMGPPGYVPHFMENIHFNQNEQPKQFLELNGRMPSVEPNVNQASNSLVNTTIENSDIKPVIDSRYIKKERKIGNRKSSYWSVKITDNSFKFYGCAVCNVSYLTLQELDQHVTIHKDRITSYDLKIKNQMRRKKLRKEMKKKKKIGSKVKKEEPLIEIKPEDGYIGNEKASDFNFNGNDTGNNGNISQAPLPESNLKSKSPNNISVNDSSSNANKNNDNNNLEKIYKCFACQKQFLLSYYLKLHVRSHTDEKPYICSMCGQSFITASKLGRHTKRIHLDVRYQCRICYRFFSRFECLTAHFDKKHPDDKLEGEPYDYNAILPYLKELEEQLMKEKNAETKPKSEDLWEDWPAPVEAEVQKHENTVEILVEEVKVDVQIKSETEEVPEIEEPQEPPGVPHEEPLDVPDDLPNHHDDELKDEMDVKDENLKDENVSDEDFPKNTWVPPTPKPDPIADVPTKKKKKSDKPLQCKICEKKISSKTYLRIHMRTHTGERPFKCYICNKSFITSSKLHRHILTHSETWEGEEQSVKVEDIKNEADDEKVDVKKGDKKDKIKRAKAKFKQTKKDVTNRKKRWPHVCEFCHRKFLHLNTLQIHKKCHAEEELVLRCSYCLAEMIDEMALKEHEPTHLPPKPYLCTICGRTYKKRETMIYHRKQHKPDKEFVCDICSKSFTAPCKLQRHIASHRENKFVLRYECPVCAHMFNTKYHIQMHLTSHQKEGLIQEENRNDILAMVLQNARKFPKNADSTSNLTDVIPSDERSRICNICGEIFQHFYYLEEHLKSHGSKIAIEDINKEEEKKYICQVCNKGFKLHYYLKLHSYTHTKEKPYICQQCGKGFITKGKLKRHIETHSGLKKYQCHICYKFFTRTSYLRIHVRTIHGTQDYNFRLEKEPNQPLWLGGNYNLALGHHSE